LFVRLNAISLALILVMYEVGITIHVTVKVHNVSHASTFCRLGLVCGTLDSWNTNYTDDQARFVLSSIWERVVIKQVQSWRRLLSGWWLGGQIAGPGVLLWSVVLALPHRVLLRTREEISFNGNVTILVHGHNEQSLASTE